MAVICIGSKTEKTKEAVDFLFYYKKTRNPELNFSCDKKKKKKKKKLTHQGQGSLPRRRP